MTKDKYWGKKGFVAFFLILELSLFQRRWCQATKKDVLRFKARFVLLYKQHKADGNNEDHQTSVRQERC